MSDTETNTEEDKRRQSGRIRGMLGRLKRNDEHQESKRPSSAPPIKKASSSDEEDSEPNEKRKPRSRKHTKNKRRDGSPSLSPTASPRKEDREDLSRSMHPRAISERSFSSPNKSSESRLKGPNSGTRVTRPTSNGGGEKLLALHDMKLDSLSGANASNSATSTRRLSAEDSSIKLEPQSHIVRRRGTAGSGDKSKIEPRTEFSQIRRPVEAKSENNDGPKLTKKGQVQHEFIQTEETYFKALTILVDLYLKPMQTEKIISNEDIEKIFSNILTIWEIHRQLAANLQRAVIDTAATYSRQSSYALQTKNSAYAKFKQLEQEMQNQQPPSTSAPSSAEKPKPSDSDKVSFYEALRQFIPFLKMYTVYVNAFDEANKRILALQKNKKFTTFCAKVKEHPECNNLDLPAYLIMPIQRLPRYELLLRDLLKFVDPRLGPRSKKEYEEMDVLLKTVQEVNQHVNSSKGKQQKRELLYKVNAAVKGKIDIFDRPDRQLVREGNASFAGEGGGEAAGASVAALAEGKAAAPKNKGAWKKCCIFLFDDLILLVNPKKYKYLLQVSVKSLTVEPDVENGESNDEEAGTIKFFECLKEEDRSDSFVVQDQKEGLVYFFKLESTTERNEWVKDLKETIKAAKDVGKSKEAPVIETKQRPGPAKPKQFQDPTFRSNGGILTSSMINIPGGRLETPGQDMFMRLKSQFENKG